MDEEIVIITRHRNKRILEIRLDFLRDAEHLDQVYDSVMEAVLHWPYDNRVLIAEPEQFYAFRSTLDKKRLRYLLRVAHKDNEVVVVKPTLPETFTGVVLWALGLRKNLFTDRITALDAIARKLRG